MLKVNKDKYIVTDIETNGLLDTSTRFWCAWIYDSMSDSYKGYRDLSLYCADLNDYASRGYGIVGHNFIKFDIPCLKKLTGKDFAFDPWEVVMDTLVLGRLIHSNIKDIDMDLIKVGRLPKSLFGSHSLKAYGYRLGELKGTYGEKEEAWDEFSDEMYAYCKQDVHVTKLLFEKLMKKGYPEWPIQLEHNIAWVMAKQERNGFVFDETKAVELYGELSSKRASLEKGLVDTFGSWSVYKGDKVYKRDNAKRGIKAGIPYPQYEEVTFNPASSAHRAKVLMDRGWKPTEYTPTGQVRTDEESLKTALDIPETKDILEYLLVEKRLSQLAEGDNAWLKLMRRDPDGLIRIHGSVNPNGAVTGRATHAYPNVAQVPSGNSPYGEECRSLFTVPDGWVEAGIDACGLELRCLAHYLYPYDKGDYASVILNGDIHTHNQQMAGLATRAQAKTFIYGTMYGAGDAKIGEIVGGSASDGKKLKERFKKGVPAYKKLCDTLEHTLIESSNWTNGIQHVKWRARVHRNCPELSVTHCIIGLDGRPIYCRSPHSALNTLLQSCGAIVCKTWVCFLERNLRKAGLKHGWNGDFAMMAWVHDETQIACRTEVIAKKVIEIAQQSMREVESFYKFNIRLDTEGKYGRNWAECH